MLIYVAIRGSLDSFYKILLVETSLFSNFSLYNAPLVHNLLGQECV